MSSQPPPPPPPPMPPSPPNSGGVRRHHTISASSRSARNATREPISEELQDQAYWNEDEVVDDDWAGGVGAVGEKTSLHRQSSLPTKYHRGFSGASKTGTHTPKTVNSLAAITGHEGDEEPWNIAGGYPVEDEAAADTPHHQQSLDPSHFAGNPNEQSPPLASNVRRHVSLTYGSTVGNPRKMATPGGLKRSGTLQAPMPAHSHNSTPPDTSESFEETNYDYEEDSNVYEEDEYSHTQQYPAQSQQYGGSPVGRQSSPWAQQGNEWRNTTSSTFASGNNGNQNAAIDDVQRALSALEIQSAQLYQSPGGQSNHPPRFNPPHPPAPQGPGMRNNGSNIRPPPSATGVDGRKTPVSQGSSYVQQQDGRNQPSGGTWDNKGRVLNTRSSNPNLQYGYQSGKGDAIVPSVPPIPQQYIQQQQLRGTGSSSYNPGNGQQGQQQQQQQQVGAGQQQFSNAPIDVPSLIATKGYNPTNFDIRPQFARYFVIKSYTEDDVHKSLKYEIWSSTDPGNKRLDKAFKETTGRGPIYLFFSVNASGHFCGMAEMLSPVDYSRSSTVWASDKWKGVFSVRWIFVRDIPNVNLRHIKLNNTQERKPVTNSRDTQELLPDAGQEMLRIFHTHPARTSLLQDFAFYELQSIQKMQGQQGSPSPTNSGDSGAHSPQQQQQPPSQQSQQQNMPFNMSPNLGALDYSMPQMSPMMQMQMGMGVGMGMGSQYGIPQVQAMHQSVMRHPSPSPQNLSGQNYMGF